MNRLIINLSALLSFVKKLQVDVHYYFYASTAGLRLPEPSLPNQRSHYKRADLQVGRNKEEITKHSKKVYNLSARWNNIEAQSFGKAFF